MVGEGVGHNDPGVFWKSRKWSRESGLRLEACLIRRLGGTGNDKLSSSIKLMSAFSCLFLCTKQRTGSGEFLDQSRHSVTVGSLFPIGRHDCFHSVPQS